MASPEDQIFIEIGKGAIITVAVAIGMSAYLWASGLWKKGAGEKAQQSQPKQVESSKRQQL